MERNRKHYVAGGALLLLIAVAGLFFLRSGEKAEGDTARPENPKRLSALKNSFGREFAPRKVTIEPVEVPEKDFDPYEEWETSRILSYFAVPTVDFDCENMLEALERVREIYAEHGGRNIEFAIAGGGDIGFPVVLKSEEHLSMRDLLDLVAGLGGYEVEVDGRLVTFRRNQIALAEDQPMTVQLKGKPSLLVTEDNGVATGGPFGENPPDPTLSPREWFQRFGLDFAEGNALKVDGESGDWVITDTKSQVMRVLTVYDIMAGGRPRGIEGDQLLIEVASFGERGRSDFETQTYSGNAEFYDSLAAYSEGRDVSVMMSPSIVMRAGQRAKIEVIREVIYPTEFEADGNPTSFDNRPIGFTMELDAKLAGLDKILIKGVADFTLVGDMELSDLIKSDDSRNWEIPNPKGRTWADGDFRSMTTEVEGMLIKGNTVGYNAGGDGKTELLQFVTANRIEDQGRRSYEASGN